MAAPSPSSLTETPAPPAAEGPEDRRWLSGGVAAAALVLTALAWARHALHGSGVFDLGIFDQALWLIATGHPPLSSALGFPILGDHAAVVLYPLALLVGWTPGPWALLAVQAMALAAGAIPVHRLARRAGWGGGLARAWVLAYLLSPIVLNVDLFDFHPEALALPCLLAALDALEVGAVVPFALACAGALACKEVLALTVGALGAVAIATRPDRRRLGLVALGLAAAWFPVATHVIIPRFSGHPVAALGRYAYLGTGGIGPMVRTLFTRPDVWWPHVVNAQVLGYVAMLLLPVAGGAALGRLDLLAPALPAFALNALSTAPAQTDLLHQYSVPVLPFLLVAAMRSAWLQRLATRGRARAWVLGWAIAGSLLLGRWGMVPQLAAANLGHLGDLTAAERRVDPSSPVLASHEIAPHLAHRVRADFYVDGTTLADPAYRWVLVDLARPGWRTTAASLSVQAAEVWRDPRFAVRYDHGGVLLFERKGAHKI